MSTQEILAQVAAGTLAPEAASKLLPSGNGNGGPQGFSMTVTSEKKCLMVKGPGLNARMGCTQYAQGWETILKHADDIRKFIAAHPELARK
jgi:hypothetical protein